MTVLNRAEDVANALAARLKAITVANGCETDAGARVFLGRRSIDDSAVPCASLIEGADNPQEQTPASAKVVQEQTYVLHAYVACDPDEPNVAGHQALRDLKRALFTTGGRSDSTLGGQVRQVLYKGRDIQPRADGAGIVRVGIEIAIRYSEDLANP